MLSSEANEFKLTCLNDSRGSTETNLYPSTRPVSRAKSLDYLGDKC